MVPAYLNLKKQSLAVALLTVSMLSAQASYGMISDSSESSDLDQQQKVSKLKFKFQKNGDSKERRREKRNEGRDELEQKLKLKEETYKDWQTKLLSLPDPRHIPWNLRDENGIFHFGFAEDSIAPGKSIREYTSPKYGKLTQRGNIDYINKEVIFRCDRRPQQTYSFNNKIDVKHHDNYNFFSSSK